MTCLAFSQKLLTLLLISAAAACSMVPEGGPAGNNGSADGTGTKFVEGYWGGTFRNLKADEDDVIEKTPVKAYFKASEESDADDFFGDFTIDLPKIEGAKVVGTYTGFPDSKTLLLEIKESELSSIGLAGTATSVDFELTGRALKLDNDDIKLEMTRRTDADDDGQSGSGGGSGSGDANKKDPPIVGLFRCNDNGRDWLFTVQNASRFTATIRESGKRNLNYSGTVTIYDEDAPDSAGFVVTNATLSSHVGLQLRANLDGDTGIILRRVKPDAEGGVDTIGESMTCTRE